jgi:hypothetical protein
VVEKWWNGMAAAEEDMNPASAPGLGMKSASADEEAPAMAAIEDRTWQSPNILPSFLPRPAGRSTERGRKKCRTPSSLTLVVPGWPDACVPPNRSKQLKSTAKHGRSSTGGEEEDLARGAGKGKLWRKEEKERDRRGGGGGGNGGRTERWK